MLDEENQVEKKKKLSITGSKLKINISPRKNDQIRNFNMANNKSYKTNE